MIGTDRGRRRRRRHLRRRRRRRRRRRCRRRRRKSILVERRVDVNLQNLRRRAAAPRCESNKHPCCLFFPELDRNGSLKNGRIPTASIFLNLDQF